MNFNFGEVLSRAWQIVWKRRGLWIFGILASCGRGGSNFNWNYNDSSSYNGRIPTLPPQAYPFLHFLAENMVSIIAITVGIICIIWIIMIFIGTVGKIGLIPKRASGEKAANEEQKAELAKGKVLIKDAIADITLQQVLTRPDEFDVIATMNLNGDYISDALAAQVGGIGIAPGGNINYVTGHAVFEATHGTPPKYADLDKVNPGSVVLSGEMMLRHMGWTEAADLIIKGMDGAIGSKTVTYDFARLMEGATEVKCSEFGDAVIKQM